MSRFKFKRKELVYLKDRCHSPLVVVDRTVDKDGQLLYKLNYTTQYYSYKFNKIQNWINVYICIPLSIKRKYKLSNLVWRIFLHRELIKTGEEFKVGFLNYPREDNWVQEDRLSKDIFQSSINHICSDNGCELLGKFMNA